MDLKLLRKELFGEGTTGNGAESTMQPKKYEKPDWDTLIDKYSKQHPTVPKNVVKAILEQESGGDPNAVGKETKYGTAKGGFQFIDTTAKQYIPDWQSPNDSFDPEKATAGAFRYMEDLLKQNNGDVKKAVGRYFGTGVDPVLNKSTEEYANEVMARTGEQQQPVVEPKNERMDFIKSSLFGGDSNQGYIKESLFGGDQQPEQQQMEPIAGAQTVEQAPPPEKKPGYLQDLGNAATSGIAKAVESFYTLPAAMASTYLLGSNLTNKAINKIVGKQVLNENVKIPSWLIDNNLVQTPKKVAEESAKKVSTASSGDNLLSLAAKGDLVGAGKYLGTWVAQQAPNQVMNMGMFMFGIPKAEVLGYISLATAGEKEAENKEKVDTGEMSQLQSSISSVIGGAAEGGFEAFGDAKVAEGLKSAFAEKVAEIGVDGATETFKKTFQRVAQGFLKAAGQEVPSEVATQIAQDLTDKYSGVNPGLTAEQMWANLVDVSAGTLVMGGAPGMVTGFKESQNIREGQKQFNAAKGMIESDPNTQRVMNTPDFTGTVEPIVDMQGYRDRMQQEVAGKIQSEQMEPTSPQPLRFTDQAGEEVGPTENFKAGVLNEGTQMKPIAEPVQDDGPQEITATEEQLNVGKELARKLTDVEFQGSNPGFKGVNKKTGKESVIQPTYEFKDKISGGNITLYEEQLDEETLNKKLAEKRGTIDSEKKEVATKKDKKPTLPKDSKTGSGNELSGGVDLKDKKTKISREQWSKMDYADITKLQDDLGPNVEFEDYEDFYDKFKKNVEKTDKDKTGERAKVIVPKDEEISVEKEQKGGIEIVRNKRVEEDTILTDKDLLIKAKDGSNTRYSYDDLNMEEYNTTKKIYDDYKASLAEREVALSKMPVSKEQAEEKRDIARTKHAINKWEKEVKPWMEKSLKEKGVEVGTKDNSPEITAVKRPEEQKAEIEAINTNPTEPQKEAGNYRKAHIKRDGFDISIENAAGQERKGADKTGKEWKVTMNHDYGYIRGTKGADAYRGRGTDQLDVFIKPDSPEGGDVFVVNQKNPVTGKFDEHKVMIGFDNKEDAAKAYLSNYEKGWKGMKSVVRMPMDKFKEWAYSDQTQYELKESEVDTKDDNTVIEKMTTNLFDNLIKFRQNADGKPLSEAETQEILSSSKKQAGDLHLKIKNKDIDSLEARLTVIDNKGSRNAFETATGIKLPGTVKGTQQAIRDFVGAENYDKHYADKSESAKKKAEEEKKSAYNAERDKLLGAKVTYEGKPVTYKDMIDQRIAEGWTVKKEKVGIRQVYKITDGKRSIVLPKKMMGEYAEEKAGGTEEVKPDGLAILNRELKKKKEEMRGAMNFPAKIELNREVKAIEAKIRNYVPEDEQTSAIEKEDPSQTDQLDDEVDVTLPTRKKIWQQTRKEIIEERDRRVKWYKGAKRNIATGQKWADKAENKKMTKDIEEEIRYYNKILDSVHKERIIEAIQDGEKIPDEVLNDYPELNQTSAIKKVEPTKGETPSSDKYYVDLRNANTKLEVESDVIDINSPSNIKGKFFAYKTKEGTWNLTNKETGASVTESKSKNINEAKKEFTDFIAEKADKINLAIAEYKKSAKVTKTIKSKKIFDKFISGQNISEREITEAYENGVLSEKVETSPSESHFYKNGDKAKYTGKSEMLYGKMAYEGEYLEGHKKGKKVYTYKAPEAMEKTEVSSSENEVSDQNEKLVSDYVHLIKTYHGNKKKIPNTRSILDIADKAHGGTIAEGKYGIRDAYDALETAMNKYVEEVGFDDDPKETIRKLNNAIKVLPTQTVRTEDQVEKQQFSTPPSEAYLAVMASGIKPGMSGLEPSAGDGNIATIMRLANKGDGTIHVNEIDERRRGNLKILGFKPTNADAEYLHSTLPKEVQPDVVVMNPPFSATGGRLKHHDTGFGAEHVRQALLRLKDGGRLVAIVGNGMAFGKPKMASWWNSIREKYNVRANIGISGKEYEKYGTGFDNNIIVIDKTGKTGSIETIITGSDLTVEKAYDLLEPLTKEDVNGRIKRDVTSGAEKVGIKEPGGESFEKKPGDGANTSSSGGRGRGPSGKKGTGADKATVGDMVKPDNELPGEDGNGSDGKAVEGNTGDRNKKDEAGGDDLVNEKSGYDDTGRLERERAGEGRIEEEEGGVYAKYRVKKATYTGAVPHQADIVESATMASVDLPNATYKMAIPKEIIKKGAPSDIQLEAATYACQTHEQRLPDGRRKEYLLGDSTGTGKTITILTTIYENWLNGRKQSVIITKSKGLIKDLRDDMKMMGIDIPVIDLSDYKMSEDVPVPEGILFSTYSTASGNWVKGKERYNQIMKWFGKDNDGVFVFDEAHMMKNANAEQPTNTGSMGVKFKEDLRNARFVNASATAATNSKNLAYLTRMGLWGEGSSFKNFTEFLGTMAQGGLGAMELLSRDMKANGNYISRTISYKGVKYESLNHTMNETEIASYNSMADFWSEILQKMDDAAMASGLTGRAARNHAKQYYAAQQRFFLQLMVSFQVETMLKDADKKLAENKSVVISLFNTNEQQTEKKVGDAQAQGVDIDDMDFTPRDMMVDMIRKNFPVYQYQEVQRDDNTTELVQVKDSAGNPLKNAENEMIMNELIDKVATFKMPDNPLDRIVNYFGEGKVAEVTGRKKRLVMVNGKKTYKARASKDISAKDVNRNELDQFMDGKKRVAVLSGAAATGFSFHASTKRKNQQTRVFYALQLSWSADVQMQAFGRVHRTMQVTAPEIVLVQTDVASQKRLVNTIQSRLASLGAISKGERESLSGGIFSIEDITDQYGEAALRDTLGTMSNEMLKRMGLLTKNGDVKDPDVDGFLNRLMVLQVKDQNEIFEKFYSAYRSGVEKAKEAGTYDTGVTKIKGENIRIEGEPILLSDDKESGVKTEIVNIAHDTESTRYTFKEMKSKLSQWTVNYVKNKRSGEPYMAYLRNSDMYVYGPKGLSKKITYTKIAEEFHDKFEEVSDEKQFKDMWEAKYKEIPAISTQHTHIITGSIFNNYKKIFEADAEGAFSKLKVYRAVLENGTSRIGVYIPQSMIEKIKQNFGIGTDLVTASPEQIIDLVKGGSIIEFDNRWKLKKSRVMGEERIELNIGNEYNTGYIEKMGLFNEIIAGQKRYFVPTGDALVGTIKNILDKTKPVRDLTVKSTETEMASALPVPEFKITDLAKPVTPTPVKVDPVSTVKTVLPGNKMKYAQASNAIGKHIAPKESKNKNGDGFLAAQEKWYQKWVDLSWPITKVADIYNKDMGISEKTIKEIDVRIDRVRGAGGMAAQFINDNLKPIFDSLGKNRGEIYTELNKYLVAKRSTWLYENKKTYIDMGISRQSAETFVEFIETGAHPYSQEIQDAAGKIWEYGKKVLQIKKDHGIIDDFIMASLTDPYYVPFYRNIEEERTASNVPRGERFTSTSKGIKKIRGSLSGKQIVDPIQNLMEHTYETMVNAARADVANLLIDMAEESETVGEMFQKVDPKWVKVGTIEHRGTMDVLLRPQIDALAKDLGITTEYKTKLAARVGRKLQKVLGKYEEGGKLKMLVGATEETYAHELGHGIHEKYSWYNTLVEKYDSELDAVADSRHTGIEAPASFVKYCRETTEKAAEFISMYVTDRKVLKSLAPNMLVEFEAKIKKDPILKKLIPMKPSNVRGLVTKEENNFVMDWHIPQDADVISVLRDGKIVSYRVPIELADAVKNLHPVMFPAWFKVLTIPNRMLRRGAVSMNIDFMFPNSFRDQQEAAMNARSIPVVDALIGLKEYASNGEWMKRYLRAGGGMESVEAGTRGFVANAEKLKYGSSYGKYLDPVFWQETGVLKAASSLVWAGVKSPFKAIEILGEASEMATRVGTFRRAQVGVPKWLEWYSGKSKTEAEAMHIARQATVDFQRFGSYGRTMNEVIPFINAAIQGTDKMVRTFKDDPKRAILSAMVYGFTPMLGLWLWNRDDELYKAIPLQEKLNNFIIMHPNGKSYFKIPKGHITKFIVNPAQVIIEKLNGGISKDNFPTAMQMLDDLSPVDISSIPVALRLIIEPIANYDLYWKKEIETPAMKGISEAGERSDTRTSHTIKMIGRALNISPAMMQHEIELVGAGTAKNALWIADNILVMAGIADGSLDAGKFGVERAPVSRRFYGKVTEWGSDVDAAIREINTELSSMNKATRYQLEKRLKYSPEKVKNIKQSNQRKTKLLLSKRAELMKAKMAITKLLQQE